ncbi:hypothetical protein Sarmat_00926 [Rickettsiales endosymbiont of Paramecium tredecaurelia]|uniref:monovalent cation/H(+) antiporter subunit G n=1 Tax=Candidatus Sarmatiella mevalonica TaxID=2770581 RepID=UPI0019206803|nr:monovalent cation/H(+) antiporter subunit G [Candidatus Sarmatiella mevalonica]MBL3285060.1 hypothetical protein [Candidatus Sarmatiella mevalonica]
MSAIFTIVTWLFLIKCLGFLLIALGLIVLALSMVGLLRFSGLRAKIQAVGLMDICGFVSIFIGLGLCFLWLLPKMLLLILLMMILSPLVSNIICRIGQIDKKR